MVEYTVTIVRSDQTNEQVASHSIKLSDEDIKNLIKSTTEFHKRLSELEYVVLTEALLSLRNLERAVEAAKIV